ncbi:MAG: hypothetical protein P1U46_00420 [Patescibacteria group bacterium]|nr:hypothetical protein [Patescibacteria group bacterium]
MITFFVSFVTLEFFHQIIHQRANIFSSSAITISSLSSLYSISFSPIKVSSFFADLIIIFHFILSASKR